MPLDRNTDVVLANAIKGLHFVRDLSEPGHESMLSRIGKLCLGPFVVLASAAGAG